MVFSAQVKVMPLEGLLDPQGKAVLGGLQHLGFKEMKDVRIGKHIDLQIEAENKDVALKLANDAAKKLLANPVMEVFEVIIS